MDLLLPTVFFFFRAKTISKVTVIKTYKKTTVEPRFNEVPRDWGNLFVTVEASLYPARSNANPVVPESNINK